MEGQTFAVLFVRRMIGIEQLELAQELEGFSQSKLSRVEHLKVHEIPEDLVRHLEIRYGANPEFLSSNIGYPFKFGPNKDIPYSNPEPSEVPRLSKDFKMGEKVIYVDGKIKFKGRVQMNESEIEYPNFVFKAGTLKGIKESILSESKNKKFIIPDWSLVKIDD